jgi:hypothetical protein
MRPESPVCQTGSLTLGHLVEARAEGEEMTATAKISGKQWSPEEDERLRKCQAAAQNFVPRGRGFEVRRSNRLISTTQITLNALMSRPLGEGRRPWRKGDEGPGARNWALLVGKTTLTLIRLIRRRPAETGRDEK